jgi:hypothetical protein
LLLLASIAGCSGRSRKISFCKEARRWQGKLGVWGDADDVSDGRLTRSLPQHGHPRYSTAAQPGMPVAKPDARGVLVAGEGGLPRDRSLESGH